MPVIDETILPFINFGTKVLFGAITGGLGYDPRQSHAVNTFHLYMWTFFCALPIILIFCLASVNLLIIVEIVYPIVILLLFTLVKVINFYCHIKLDGHDKKKDTTTASPRATPTMQPAATTTSPSNASTNLLDTTQTNYDQIPQLDGGSDTGNEAKLRTLTFFDESGAEISYEIYLTETEYEAMKAEMAQSSRGRQRQSTSSNNNTTTTTTTTTTPVEVNQSTPNSRPVSQRSVDSTNSNDLVSAQRPPSPVEPNKFSFTRQELEVLIDRDFHWSESVISVFLATLVAWASIRFLAMYNTRVEIVFLFVAVASSHFSLLKSPQPDSNSPVHYNRSNSFSRAYAFLVFGAVAIGSFYIAQIVASTFFFYGLEVHIPSVFYVIYRIFAYIILMFPLMFTFGWIPQPTTLTMVILEGMHVHMFGGTGFVNLTSAILHFIFDLAMVGILLGVGYYSVDTRRFGKDYISGIYGAVLVALSYLASRAPGNFHYYLSLFTDGIGKLFKKQVKADDEEISAFQRNLNDVTPWKRMAIDLIVAIVAAIPVLVIQLFDAVAFLNPYLLYVLTGIICAIGLIVHYLIPQLKKRYPFSIFKFPFLNSNIETMECFGKTMYKWAWFEYISYALRWIECILYTIIVISSLSVGFDRLSSKGFHPALSLVIISIVSIRILRSVYSDPSRMWIALFFAVIIFKIDYIKESETVLIDLFLFIYIILKFETLQLKFQFVHTYGHPFLALYSFLVYGMIVFGVPQLALILTQFALAVLVGAPMIPFIGAPLYMLSYPRSIRFWEREYETVRKDNSNTKLAQSLGMAHSNQEYDMNNLDCIFYEHLVASIRRKLPDWIKRGALGAVQNGNFYILMNDSLFAMIQIIEVGNGFCTFQLRGVEFKGTICQEQEQGHVLELVKGEKSTLDEMLEGCGLDRFNPFMGLLSSLDLMLHSWEIINTNVSLKTYSVSNNELGVMINSFDTRSMLISFYVRACIYYTSIRDELDYWISTDSPFATIMERIEQDKSFAEIDPVFDSKFDVDFDNKKKGVTLERFLSTYQPVIDYCITKRQEERKITYEDAKKQRIYILCFLVSLVARRAFASPFGTSTASSLAEFEDKLLQLFKGDYRLTAQNDEWVFGDVTLIEKVIAKAIRLGVRLFQDSFTDDLDSPEGLYECLVSYGDPRKFVICHEADPEWRLAILRDTPQMCSVRRTVQQSSRGAKYSIIRLTLSEIQFNVLQLNRESVTALWASQLQELSFIGNELAERASIQQMRHVLRNVINSSCDLPVGYPSFVSPLTTSFW